MTGDQFPLGTGGNGSGSRGVGGAGGIDANLSINEQDLTYKPSGCAKLWFLYYSARTWWSSQRAWVRAAIFSVPILALLLVILILAICLGIAVKKNKQSDICSTPECIRTAGRIVALMNLTANPCLEFYDFACGGYTANEEIPIGKTMSTQFTKREAVIMRQLKQILEKAPRDPSDKVATKVRAYYYSCLNSSGVQANGLPRLRRMVQDLGGFMLVNSTNNSLPTTTDGWSLEDAVLRRSRYTMNGLFQVGISQDFYNTSRNAIFLDRGKLGLGADTREFYVNKTASSDAVLLAYSQLLQTYLALISGQTIPLSTVLEIVALEQKLAAIQSPAEDRRSSAQMYRKINLEELYKNASYVKWDRYLSNVFAMAGSSVRMDPKEVVVVLDLPYFKNLSAILANYTSTPNGIRTLHNYIVLHAVATYAPRMGADFARAYARFLTIYSGNRGTPEPWLDCLGDTNSKLGFGLGKMYVDRFSPADHKPKAMSLIKDVYSSYRGLVSGATWMDEWTRAAALDKLDAMQYDVAFPDWLRNSDYVNDNYINFTVTTDYTSNLFQYYNHSIRVAVNRYKVRPDSTRWSITPQTINGMYEATQNTVFVAAALLNEPFFYMTPGLPESLSYGSMGAMIGHEIAHGFDEKGRQFDKYGNLRNWWTSKTLVTFVNHTQCFVKQYNGYTIDGYRVKGVQTLSENAADSSGIRAAFAAYKKAQREGRASALNAKLAGLNLNADQLFYLSYAQTYCSVLTKESLRNQVAQNPHSPAAVRVLGALANSAEFSQTFKCSAVTKMNRNNKCYLW